MKTKPLILISIVSIFGVGGYLIDHARSERESRISGYFESQPTQAASRLGGRVIQILVKEGDRVKAGQALVQLEAESFGATVEASRKGTEEAYQQYKLMTQGTREEDIAKQAAVVQEAQANLDRLMNGPLPEEILTGRAKFAGSRAIFNKMLAGARPEEIASAHAARNVAFEKYQQAQRGLTPEEVNQLKARLDAALADEALAKKQLDRQQALYSEGAVAKREFDTALATYQQAVAHTQDARQAHLRAIEGTPKEELAQAREAYRQAQAQLDLVVKGNRKEDIESARQQMLADQHNLDLILRGSRSEDIRAARARLDQTKTNLLELQRGNRKEDVARSKAAFQQAEFQARSSDDTLMERTVFAAQDALVDRILVAVGDLVSANSAVAQLSYPDDLWLRVYIPEAQLPRVQVGDSADLAIDGISTLAKGVVESIATTGEFTPVNLQSPEERGLQVFAVRIRLAQPDRRVKAGMYVTVKKVGLWP